MFQTQLCNCKKSECTTKACGCRKKDTVCSETCGCINCQNREKLVVKEAFKKEWDKMALLNLPTREEEKQEQEKVEEEVFQTDVKIASWNMCHFSAVRSTSL